MPVACMTDGFNSAGPRSSIHSHMTVGRAAMESRALGPRWAVSYDDSPHLYCFVAIGYRPY